MQRSDRLSSVNTSNPPPISTTKLRVGILLFVIWWIPIYLTVPLVVGALGDAGNAHATKVVTISIIAAQSLIGLAGLLLLGKQLTLTLKRVPFKKMPRALWRALKSGSTPTDAKNDTPR
jgi:hypothetical protein